MVMAEKEYEAPEGTERAREALCWHSTMLGGFVSKERKKGREEGME
jgi:hypothetical protein